ncbi:regucalcin-like [Belonocnema kinseyi]|uniref:regucalcin-like n=1 Tax=Belonocnema kinseyi TaxID=2817044 RepID=UPI00143D3B04|nr:regucalcin-like [Belonocnema kinseyi]
MNTDGLKLANVSTLNSSLDLRVHISGLVWCKGFVLEIFALPSQFYLVTSEKHYNLLVHTFNGRSGKVGNPKPLFDWTQQHMTGSPRRLIVDNNGHLWMALDGGHGVIQVDPNSKLMKQFIGMPAERHNRQHPQQDKSGSIFALRGLGVHGKPPGEYKLNTVIINAKLPEHL